ncbi:hypothetical protein [Lysinibacillus antri]|uniref:Uncharacterized protein n=1 Tax=Lysinibacillus antri TaxID=2498145 RepID=A0A432L9N9_9BACI|nr:hypothetical protein [Lysinibacillus antri]RUL49885.1 hypothetical protein EK386_14515 [Lysinibacillus antri]
MFPPKLPIPFPIPDLGTIFKTAKKIFDLFFNKDQEQEAVKETISKQKPTDINVTEISDIYELNSILNSFSMLLQQKANTIEYEIIKECNYFFDDLQDTLSMLNDDNKNFILFKLDRYTRKLEKIKSDLTGTMANFISRRVSLDDEECRRILKMLPGATKSKRMDEFEQSVIFEAVMEVTNKIKEKMVDFEEDLVQVIEDRMEEISKVATKNESSFLQLIESKNHDVQKYEQVKIESMLAVEQSEYLLDLLRKES